MGNRREFPKPVQREIKQRSGGKCECYRMDEDIIHMFPKDCDREAAEIDHIYADVLESEEAKQKPLTAEDGAHLSRACHRIKTATDQAYRKKRNAHKVRRDRPKKKPTGKKWASRGFTQWKNFKGEIVRRKK